MKNNKLVQVLALFFIACLCSTATAEWDSRVVGDWVSSSGAKIKIDYANEDTTVVVSLSINGGAPIRTTLEGSDMDGIILTYRVPSGSIIKGYLNAETKQISVFEKDKQIGTWSKRR